MSSLKIVNPIKCIMYYILLYMLWTVKYKLYINKFTQNWLFRLCTVIMLFQRKLYGPFFLNRLSITKTNFPYFTLYTKFKYNLSYKITCVLFITTISQNNYDTANRTRSFLLLFYKPTFCSCGFVYLREYLPPLKYIIAKHELFYVCRWKYVFFCLWTVDE